MRYIFFVMVVLALQVLQVDATLDGRTAPIIIDYRYTFTNWEVARGFVVFRKGFDLPINGTITLNLSGEAGIYDSINMNNGSIQLFGNIFLRSGATFLGNGFIFSKFISLCTIYFDNNLILNGNYIGISATRFAIRGSNKGRFDFVNNATLDLSHVQGVCSISNCRFFDHGTSLVTPTTVNGFSFDNCALFLGVDNTTEYLVPILNLNGIGSLVTNNLFKVKAIGMAGTSEWSILSGSKMQSGNLNLFFDQTRLFIYDAEIDLVSTTTNPVIIGVVGGNSKQGLFSVVRKCKLTSSTGNTINVLSGIKLELQAGGRLLLDDDVHLTLL